MTEPLDPDGHLGLDRIADLEEGLLSAADEQVARAHLAGCDVCQADLAALAAVHEALLDDAEIAMPDDIAERIFGVLAAQPPLAPAAAAATTLPVRTGPSRWERSRRPLLVTLAAAACIALLTLGIIHLPRSSGSSSSASAGATGAAAATSAAAAAAPQILHSGHDYSAKTLGTDGAALVGGAPVTSAAAAATSAAAAPAATSAAAAAATSGAAAAPTSAAAAPTSAAAPATSAAAASAGPPGSAAAGGAAAGSSTTAAAATSAATPVPAPTTDALSQLRDPAAAQRCIALLVGTSTPPRVIDYATFAGKPAVIAVVDAPNDPTKLAVIAVGPPGCSLYSLNYVSKP